MRNATGVSQGLQQDLVDFNFSFITTSILDFERSGLIKTWKSNYVCPCPRIFFFWLFSSFCYPSFRSRLFYDFSLPSFGGNLIDAVCFFVFGFFEFRFFHLRQPEHSLLRTSTGRPVLGKTCKTSKKKTRTSQVSRFNPNPDILFHPPQRFKHQLPLIKLYVILFQR